jgi:hypothetical protein
MARQGAGQASGARLFTGWDTEAFDARTSRTVGGALAASGISDVIDAAVVVDAIERADLGVTSDPDDLTPIADALRRSLELFIV